MEAADIPENEALRLAALKRYEILDSEAEQAYDDLTLLAGTICGTSIALISLVDGHRQWFKSKQGLEASETPRELAFCAHAILGDEIFEVPNALDDERFADNPLVSDNPNIRFYAGAPLHTRDGFKLGTLCAIDNKPHRLDQTQKSALEALARQVMYLFELRLHNLELRKADEDNRKLFSTISHDLRSPFQALLGYSKRLHIKADSLKAEQIKDMSLKLWRTSETTYEQLDGLLDWARTQMNAIRYTPVRFNLQKLVEDVLETFNSKIEQKKLDLKNEVEADVYVLADATMLKSILGNLIGNAIKFTPREGKITVNAKLENNSVTVSVSDTGLGIDADTLEKFVANGCLDSTSGTDNEKGTGLGLRLCKDYLIYHDSHLSVESKPGLGATFSFAIMATD